MRRRRILQGIGAATAISAAGCLGDDDDDADDGDDTAPGDDSDDGDDSAPSVEEVVIGAIQPLTGNFSPWGETHQLGLEYGIEDANETYDDYEFILESVDTGSDPSEAAVLFSELVESDNAVAITGANSSDVGVAVAEIAEDMEVPNILHMAGDEEIISQDSRYTFRHGWPPAPPHVQADVEFVVDQGYSSVGAIVADYAWGRAVERNMEELYPDDIDVYIDVVPLGESDYSTALRDMPDDIEIMTYVGDPPGAINAASTQLELEIDVPALGVDAPQTAVYDALGDDVENVITRHVANLEGDIFLDLADRIAEEEDRPIYAYEPIGYSTGQVIAECVDAVGPDPVAIADHMRETSFDTIHENPLQYTEWGEFDGLILKFSEFVLEAPEYYPDGDFRLNTITQTEPIEPHIPE